MSEKTMLLKDALTPDLLKQVVTNSLLKEIMPDVMVFRGQARCIEDCRRQGIYSLDSNSYTNEPPIKETWNYGYMEVLIRGADLMQRITHVDGGKMYFRVYRGGAWRPWYEVQAIQAIT